MPPSTTIQPSATACCTAGVRSGRSNCSNCTRPAADDHTRSLIAGGPQNLRIRFGMTFSGRFELDNRRHGSVIDGLRKPRLGMLIRLGSLHGLRNLPGFGDPGFPGLLDPARTHVGWCEDASLPLPCMQ